MKTLIAQIKKDEKLSEPEKAAKIKKYEEKIVTVQTKCKETSASLKSELKEETKKAKQRFS